MTKTAAPVLALIIAASGTGAQDLRGPIRSVVSIEPAETPSSGTAEIAPPIDSADPATGGSAPMTAVDPAPEPMRAIFPEPGVRADARPAAAAQSMPIHPVVDVQSLLPAIEPGSAPAAAPGPEDAALGQGDRSLGVIRTLAATSGVVILILAISWVVRKAGARSSSWSWRMGAARSPQGVLEILGRYPLGGKRGLMLLRLERRVLLVSETPTGFSTLAELSDPSEVAVLLGKVRDADGDSISSQFRRALEGADRGYGQAPPMLDDREALLEDDDPVPEVDTSPLRRRIEALSAGVYA